MRKSTQILANIQDIVPTNGQGYEIGGSEINLPPNEKFVLIVDYPCNTSQFVIKTGKNGMGLVKLLKEVGRAYKTIYDNDNKYGVWGHDMSDLQLAEIVVDYTKKRITLGVDS